MFQGQQPFWFKTAMTDHQAKALTKKRLRARDKRIMRLVLECLTDPNGAYLTVMFTRSWEAIGDIMDYVHNHLAKKGIGKPGFMVYVGQPDGRPFDIALNGLRLSSVHSGVMSRRRIKVSC